MNWDIHVQEALADMLKVPWRERPVSGFSLDCRVGEVPRVTVHYDVYKDEHIDQTVGEFVVWAVGGTLAPSFDLDAAVEKAQKSVLEVVKSAYSREIRKFCGQSVEPPWLDSEVRYAAGDFIRLDRIGEKVSYLRCLRAAEKA
jgi:hypothetical protein